MLSTSSIRTATKQSSSCRGEGERRGEEGEGEGG
jgi:hypothetical protein